MLKITSNNLNYLAKIVQVSTINPHPNADKLALAIVDFQSIIVGKDTQPNSLFVYFSIESQINHELLSFTNNFAKPEDNEDKTKKGFFENKHRRVRAVRLRGVVSEGYLMNLESFNAWLKSIGKPSVSELDVGKEFDSVDNILICNKYEPKIQKSSGGEKKNSLKKKVAKSRILPAYFAFHADTAAFKKSLHEIGLDDQISISAKFHGSNAVFSHTKVLRPLNWIERICKKFGLPIQDSSYDFIQASRKVIKNGYLKSGQIGGGFYDSDIWKLVGATLKDKIPPNFTAVGEIVGQTPTGQWIQKDYDYGTEPKSCDFYAFRVYFRNEMGKSFELNPQMMIEFCERQGIKYCPFYYVGTPRDFLRENCEDDFDDNENWRSLFLSTLTSFFLEKDSAHCKNQVPDEGVVIRKISMYEWRAYKLKSARFLERETKELDEGRGDFSEDEKMGESLEEELKQIETKQ